MAKITEALSLKLCLRDAIGEEVDPRVHCGGFTPEGIGWSVRKYTVCFIEEQMEPEDSALTIEPDDRTVDCLECRRAYECVGVDSLATLEARGRQLYARMALFEKQVQRTKQYLFSQKDHDEQ